MNAEIRREQFKIGGEPPNKNRTDELSDLLSGIIEHQQSLDVRPDGNHLDSSDEDLSKESKLVTSFGKYTVFYCLCQSLFFLYRVSAEFYKVYKNVYLSMEVVC